MPTTQATQTTTLEKSKEARQNLADSIYENINAKNTPTQIALSIKALANVERSDLELEYPKGSANKEDLASIIYKYVKGLKQLTSEEGLFLAKALKDLQISYNGSANDTNDPIAKELATLRAMVLENANGILSNKAVIDSNTQRIAALEQNASGGNNGGNGGNQGGGNNQGGGGSTTTPNANPPEAIINDFPKELKAGTYSHTFLSKNATEFEIVEISEPTILSVENNPTKANEATRFKITQPKADTQVTFKVLSRNTRIQTQARIANNLEEELEISVLIKAEAGVNPTDPNVGGNTNQGENNGNGGSGGNGNNGGSGGNGNNQGGSQVAKNPPIFTNTDFKGTLRAGSYVHTFNAKGATSYVVSKISQPNLLIPKTTQLGSNGIMEFEVIAPDKDTNVTLEVTAINDYGSTKETFATKILDLKGELDPKIKAPPQEANNIRLEAGFMKGNTRVVFVPPTLDENSTFTIKSLIVSNINSNIVSVEKSEVEVHQPHTFIVGEVTQDSTITFELIARSDSGHISKATTLQVKLYKDEPKIEYFGLLANLNKQTFMRINIDSKPGSDGYNNSEGANFFPTTYARKNALSKDSPTLPASSVKEEGKNYWDNAIYRELNKTFFKDIKTYIVDKDSGKEIEEYIETSKTREIEEYKKDEFGVIIETTKKVVNNLQQQKMIDNKNYILMTKIPSFHFAHVKFRDKEDVYELYLVGEKQFSVNLDSFRGFVDKQEGTLDFNWFSSNKLGNFIVASDNSGGTLKDNVITSTLHPAFKDNGKTIDALYMTPWGVYSADGKTWTCSTINNTITQNYNTTLIKEGNLKPLDYWSTVAVELLISIERGFTKCSYTNPLNLNDTGSTTYNLFTKGYVTNSLCMWRGISLDQVANRLCNLEVEGDKVKICPFSKDFNTDANYTDLSENKTDMKLHLSGMELGTFNISGFYCTGAPDSTEIIGTPIRSHGALGYNCPYPHRLTYNNHPTGARWVKHGEMRTEILNHCKSDGSINGSKNYYVPFVLKNFK